MMTEGLNGGIGGYAVGAKRPREDDEQRHSAPVSPFVLTPPSRAKSSRDVRHGDTRPEAFRGVQQSVEPSPQHTIHAETSCAPRGSSRSPVTSTPNTPSAPLFARRARASVASLRVGTHHRRVCLDEATRASIESEQIKPVSSEKSEKEAFCRDAKEADTPPSPVYLPNSKMPTCGWMQRCFGCGLWTGQVAMLGQFEVFRCNACACVFRERAREMNEKNESSDLRVGKCSVEENNSTSNTQDLTSIASKLRAFILARLPDRGLEHSIAPP